MISRSQIKNVRALSRKKNRDTSGLFIGEGPKVVGELLKTFPCRYIAATADWLQSQTLPSGCTIDEVTDEELHRISLMNTPQSVLAVFEKPQPKATLSLSPERNLILALDDVQDPGNLGTIVRLSDWFGIEDIVCSLSTADVYGPKVVQATMGAIARVNIHYLSLPEYLASIHQNVPVYGTFLEGDNIYNKKLSPSGIIVMGNEGNGISDAVSRHVTDKLYIPNFPSGRATSESLNVAVATAIVCSEFRRRITE